MEGFGGIGLFCEFARTSSFVFRFLILRAGMLVGVTLYASRVDGFNRRGIVGLGGKGRS